MSEFIRLYQERQAKRFRLKKIRRKANPDEYWKLKDEIDEIGNRLDQIIKAEKK